VSSGRLLVFDSDPSMHQFLGSVLKRPGRSIQDVYDHREVLECLRHTPCDLLLAGQGPNDGRDGIKLLRLVRSLQPEARVILTGNQDRAGLVRIIRERAYSYFHRPIPEGPLSDMVQQALEAEATWRDDIKVISARPEWITLEVRCKIGAAERTTQFTREMLADLPAMVREDVATAFRELLMNAIEHGCKSDPGKRVRVSLLRAARAVIGHIADPGRGFSLDLLPHAAISNPEGSPIRHVEVRAEKGQRPGGFGILMARNLMDDLLYNERGNAALFVKYL
jgi:anti-sigma regulatory factor (Ser/Thr protein kinase)/DNA-binding NarL/FixJ family response regulator